LYSDGLTSLLEKDSSACQDTHSWIVDWKAIKITLTIMPINRVIGVKTAKSQKHNGFTLNHNMPGCKGAWKYDCKKTANKRC
jgi:hypothetical protein